jgi:hypothetical protein
VNKKDRTVVCTDFTNGRKHDFRLFKESKIDINKKIKICADVCIHTGF